MNSGGVTIQQSQALQARVALMQCVDRANALSAVQYLAVRRLVDHCEPLLAFSQCEHPLRSYWEHPQRDYALAALGGVSAIDPSAEWLGERFSASSAAATRLLDALTVCGDTDGPDLAGPLLLGGFAFSDQHQARGEWLAFPVAQLLLPEALLVRVRGRCFVTVCQVIAPAADREVLWRELQRKLTSAERWIEQARAAMPETAVLSSFGNGPPFASGAEYRVVADRDHAVYRRQVASALRAIEAGQLEKVVLARSLRVEHPGHFAVPAFLDRLRQLYPGCVTLACARDSTTFIAASPERLVAREGDRILTGALAGSAPRGRTPEEDSRLAAQLQASAKERAEHAAVVRAIRAALAGVCWPIAGADAPELMRLEGIQHLHTPLRGRLRSAVRKPGAAGGDSLIDLVGRLHPTPAVGGLPAAAAAQWIEHREGLQRGWFGGPVGFIDRRGGGEFRVALRCGLIHNPPSAEGSAQGTELALARLFAGAGIVKGSVPELELRETRIKLRALLAPLTEI